MKDNDNKVNVGDTFIMKAKLLGYDGYCPVHGYRYNMHLLDRRNVPFSQVALYISNPEDLLDKEPTTAASVLRLFKAGDIAKCIDVRNRKPACGIAGVPVRLDGETVTVMTNEADREHGAVDIKLQCGTLVTIDPVYLELIIPVEELHPYYVVHNPGENAFEVCRTVDGKPVTRMCYFYKEGTHEGEESFCYAEMIEIEAEKAADDECTRLNEEWGKRLQHSNK